MRDNSLFLEDPPNVAAKHKSPAKADNAGSGKNFLGRKFRKDLYALSKGKDRVQVINQDSSDSDESIHVIDHKEANDARMRHVRNRLRERFAQLQKTKEVPRGTNHHGH
jgi:hypothetical protein